jgi:hypothetical protein
MLAMFGDPIPRSEVSAFAEFTMRDDACAGRTKRTSNSLSAVGDDVAVWHLCVL